MTSSQSSPLLSIIVPSFNQGKFLAETLDSILSQDYQPREVIVMDGGSRDESVAVLESYSRRWKELRWRSEPDRGVADAVNKGLAEARGIYAGIQSSDDLYRPGAFRRAVESLEADASLALVCAGTELVDSEGRVEGVDLGTAECTLANVLARACIVHQSSTFFRTDVVRAVGGWNGAYFCCDAECWMRLLFRHRGRYVPEVWSAWRRHDTQRDKEARKVWEAWRRMLSESNDLRAAPLRLRLAAEAGHSLLAQKYNPTASKWFRLYHLWRAVLLYPPSFRGIRAKSLLIPGLGTARQLMAKSLRQVR